ncbi:MAG: FG-GAP-like repeat-containing protein [Terriglobales bacterium]
MQAATVRQRSQPDWNTSRQATLASNGFDFRPSLLTGQIPTAVATGDFNGDGKLDWAVSNGQDNSIWLYFGNGDGTSQLPTILPTAGVGPAWMIATDLNGDGKLDLVVTEADSSTIGVFLGNGDGTFQPEAQYAVPAPPLFLVAGDFTGDGKVDIAAGMIGTTATGPIAVLPGDGSGHLGTALYTGDPNPSDGYWLAAADLNGDGKLDLIVVDPDTQEQGPHAGAQAYLNNGKGTFTAGQLFFANNFPPSLPPELALSVAIADLNNDGCNDAVVTESYGLAYVFNGNCNGTFATPGTTYALGDIGGAIQLVDVNGDGVLDLVTSGVLLSGAGGLGLGAVAGNEVSELLGDGTGHFGPGRTYRGDLSMYSMAVADLNGDGFPDLVTANQGSNTATVYLNDGKGGFGDPQGEAFGNDSGITNSPDSAFVFADVDGNGTLDMVLLDRQSEPTEPILITTLLNDGTGKFSAPIQSPIFAEPPDGLIPGDFVLADFRNTGQLDALVVALNFTSPFLVFAPGSGNGQFGAYTMTTPPGAMGPIAVGDFNGDGKLDFVAVSSVTNGTTTQQVLSVFLGQGDGTFQTGQSVTFQSDNRLAAPSVVYVGDFNRDGNLDVLVWNYGLFEFLGNGDGTFQAARLLFDTFGAFVLADVNRDGSPDIIAATDAFGNPYGGADAYDAIGVFSVFLGQADGTFQINQTYTPYLYTFYEPYLSGTYVPPNPFPGVVGDFNGDGNLDIAVFPSPDPLSQSSEMLYDFTYREYSPSQGRWISPDPSGLNAVDPTNPQSWNRYAYVANTPLSYADALGLYGYGCGGELHPGMDPFCQGGGSQGGGGGSNWGGGCTLDGVPTDCGSLGGLLGSNDIAGILPIGCSASFCEANGVFFPISPMGNGYYGGCRQSGWYLFCISFAPYPDSAPNNGSWAWNFTKSFFTGFSVFGPKSDPRPSCFGQFLADAGSGFVNSFAPPSPSPGEIVGVGTAMADYSNEVGIVAEQHLAQYGSRISKYTIGEQAGARAGLAGLLANADYQGAVALVNEYGSASSGQCK